MLRIKKGEGKKSKEETNFMQYIIYGMLGKKSENETKLRSIRNERILMKL
jgi:hypothetical protein